MQRPNLITFVCMFGLGLVACESESGEGAARHPDELERPAVVGPASVRQGCDMIAAATREALVSEPEMEMDAGGPGAPAPRCVVSIRRDVISIPAGAEPSAAVRSAFDASGWIEDVGAAADGAGTTAFAYFKDGVRCEVSAGRPASVVDGEIGDDGYVYLEATCSTR